MLIIIGIMLTGILTGYLLRLRLQWIQKVITVLIWVLLFLLGVEIGSNKTIITGLHTLGIEALLLTVGGIAGSILCARILWYWIEHKRSKSQQS